MRRVRWVVWCGVAVVVCSMIAAAAASAELPEFQAKNKKTEVLEPLKKHVKFTESSGSVTIRSGASELTCAASSGKGKLTGPKTLTVKTTYTGCEEPVTKATCQSGGKAGVIKTATMEETLVDANTGPGEPLVAAVSSPVMSGYTCGTTKFSVKGLALGAVTPTNVSTNELIVTYAEGEESGPGCGHQELQLVQGLAPCTHLSVQGALGPEEPAWVGAPKPKKSPPPEKTRDLAGNVTLIK